MARRTQGSALWFVAPSKTTQGEYELVKVHCPSNIKPGTDSRTKIDVTCLEEEDGKQNMLGLKEYGQATFDINVDPAKESHVRLHEISESGEKVKWIVGWAGANKGEVKAIVPSIAAATGEVTLPSSRSWNTFDGYVESFPFDWESDTVVKTTVAIQRTTSTTWVRETTSP